METSPREGVMKEEKFPNTKKSSHQWVCGEFWNLRGQHNLCSLTKTPRGERAQILVLSTSEQRRHRLHA